MAAGGARINREKATLVAMVTIYCRGRHGSCRGRLCSDCVELLEYGSERLDRCPYASAKGPCIRCTIHCYKPEMRERVGEVMRYAGPKMLTAHPILAVGHMIDGWKNKRKQQKGPA